MKQMKKLISILLVLAMTLTLLPAAVAADDSVATVGTTGYATLQGAVDAASASGGTVVLTADIELDAQVEITSGTLTLDLAGKTVSYSEGNVLYVDGADLTVTDSSTEKTGALDAGAKTIYDTGICVESGTVTVNGGSYGGYMSGISANGGTVIINDMTTADEIWGAGGDVTINGGTFADQIDISGGTVTINGGSYSISGSAYMFYLNGGDLTVNGGVFAMSKNYGFRFNVASELTLLGGTYKNGIWMSAKSGAGSAYLADYLADGVNFYDANGEVLEVGSTDKKITQYTVLSTTSPGVRVLEVSHVLTNLTSSNTATTLASGEDYVTTLIPAVGYAVPTSLRVKINGSNVSSSKYTYTDGTLTIPAANITGDIVITATAIESWTYTVEGSAAITGSGDNTMTADGTVYTKTYSAVPAATGYELSVKGASPSGTTQSATVVFDVTAACDVTVSYDTSSGEITVTGDGVALQGPADFILYYDNTTTQWSSVYIYAWNDDDTITAAWPGDTMTLVDGETDVYYAQLSGDTAYVIFHNNSGTQSADIALSGVTGNLYDHSTGSWSTYDSDMAVCTHESHDLSGNCTACGRAVGHTYVDGTCACGAVEPENTDRVIYLRNDAGWSTVYAYAWTSENGSTTNHLGSWPGTAMTAVEGESGLYSITVPSDAANIIFSNNSSNQTADLTLSADKNLYNNSTNTWSVYETSTSCSHSYSAVVTAPTCTEAGYTTYTCTLCGDSYTGSETAALGHTSGDPVENVTKAPTCTEDGTKYVTVSCSVCGESLSAGSESIPATGHSYVGGICTACGDAEYDVKFQAKTDGTAIRLLSYVGDLSEYASVTFTVTIGGKSTDLTCTNAYKSLLANGNQITASSVFGEGAEYFVMYTLTGITEAYHDLDMTVTVSWTAIDGTVTTSEARAVTIGDLVG